MKLIQLTEKHFPGFKEFADDYTNANEDKYKDYTKKDSFLGYLQKLKLQEDLNNLPEDINVRSFSFFLADESGTLYGHIRLKPELTKNLLIEGGNIGYDVRPSFRSKGYATAMLKLMLQKCPEYNLEKVLITCFADNPASEKVIQKNGGRLESIEPSPRNGKMTKRFWVNCGLKQIAE